MAAEPITHSATATHMAERDAHLTSATTHMAQGRSGCNTLLGDKLPTIKLRHLNKITNEHRAERLPLRSDASIRAESFITEKGNVPITLCIGLEPRIGGGYKPLQQRTVS